MSRTLTLLVWMWPTTVCGSDIAYSCVWMSSVVRLTTVYHCRVLLYLPHTVSCCFVVVLRSGVLPPSLCVCLVVSQTRAVEVTCSVMAIVCRLHLLSRRIYRRSLRNSRLLLPAVPVPACSDIIGAAWSPAPSQSCHTPSALRTFVPAAYHFIIYCITCSSATERSYIV